MPSTYDRLQALFAPRFRLHRALGGGSMAEVFRAEDTRHGREVAIKVLRPEYVATFAAERFLREIQIAARLQHPHIVPLLDSGDLGGTLYLVMPYVEGESLRTRLSRAGRLEIREVVRIMADVADALAHAHNKGIIHRDIKPDNVLLAGRHALVTDFGVAKAFSEATLQPRNLTGGVALGTPAYMAPEQATAAPDLDHRVDLYALGVLGYELLAGRPPFDGPTAQAILTAQVLDAPTPIDQLRPDTPVALRDLVMRLLGKAPEDRPARADELLGVLEAMVTPSGGITPAGNPPMPRPAWPRWVALAAVVSGVLALWRVLSPASPALIAAGQKQLTFVGEVTAAAVSPDGLSLAYVRSQAGQDRLLLQDLRGGNPLEVAAGRGLGAVSWSVDGSEIRYAMYDRFVRTLYAVPRLGGPSRRASSFGMTALSPDERRMAIQTGGSSQVIVVDRVRGDTTTIPLTGFLWYGEPVWSPTGDRLAFAGVTGETGQSGMIVVQLEPRRIDQVLRDSTPLSTPVWSPDGKALYFLRGHDPLADLIRLDLTGTGGGTPTAVMTGLSAKLDDLLQHQLSLSADGHRLSYIRSERWGSLGIAAIGVAGAMTTPRMLNATSAPRSFARLSPDGRRLVYVRSEPDGASLQLMPVDGGAPQDLLRMRNSGPPAWSPNGRSVAILTHGGEKSGLQLLSLDGGAMRTLLMDSVGWDVGWVSDSQLVVQLLGNRVLRVLDPVTGRLEAIPGLDSLGWSFSPLVSPDRRLLAFMWNREGHRGVNVIPLAGGQPRLVYPDMLLPLRWSPDGRAIYAATFPTGTDSAVVRRIPVGGGPPQRIVQLPPPTAAEDIDPLGRELILTLPGQRADAWLIELPGRP
jgi:Tol biopolymer transport system component